MAELLSRDRPAELAMVAQLVIARFLTSHTIEELLMLRMPSEIIMHAFHLGAEDVRVCSYVYDYVCQLSNHALNHISNKWQASNGSISTYKPYVR